MRPRTIHTTPTDRQYVLNQVELERDKEKDAAEEQERTAQMAKLDEGMEKECWDAKALDDKIQALKEMIAKLLQESANEASQKD